MKPVIKKHYPYHLGILFFLALAGICFGVFQRYLHLKKNYTTATLASQYALFSESLIKAEAALVAYGEKLPQEQLLTAHEVTQKLHASLESTYFLPLSFKEVPNTLKSLPSWRDAESLFSLCRGILRTTYSPIFINIKEKKQQPFF